MKEVELRKVKKGEWFTLKPIEDPQDNQVWVRDYYDRGSKTYSASNFSNGKERFFKGNRKVYIEFYF